MRQILGAFTCTLLLLCGCVSYQPTSGNLLADWEPWTEKIESPEHLNRALEARWSLERIRAFCDAFEPWPPYRQNLIAMGKVWRGELYQESKHEFEWIKWYAGITDTGLDKYWLSVKKGRKVWVLDAGNQNRLASPPIAVSRPKFGKKLRTWELTMEEISALRAK